MKYLFFDELDSTNTYLKNNYLLLDDLTFVSCKKQSKGRGRNNRVWYSSDNNLLFSLLIKNQKLLERYKEISLVSAYAIVKILEEYGIKDVKIKWPNDVFVNDQKICGILLEGVSKDKLECLIVGVGLNVNQKTFNEDYLISPTSMSKVLNKDIDIDELRNRVYETLIDNLNCFNIDEIRRYDYLKDKEVYAYIDNNKRLVKVIGIDEDCSLKIEVDGKQINMESGEISFHL